MSETLRLIPEHQQRMLRYAENDLAYRGESLAEAEDIVAAYEAMAPWARLCGELAAGEMVEVQPVETLARDLRAEMLEEAEEERRNGRCSIDSSDNERDLRIAEEVLDACEAVTV
jgi:hypothetical protein